MNCNQHKAHQCQHLPSHWNARRLNCRLPWLFRQAAFRIKFKLIKVCLNKYCTNIPEPIQFMKELILTWRRRVNFRQAFLLAGYSLGCTTRVYWQRPDKCSWEPSQLVVRQQEESTSHPSSKVTLRVAGVRFAWHWELATHLQDQLKQLAINRG